MGRAVLRQKRWVIGAVLLSGLLSAIGVDFIQPRYTAETKILLENRGSLVMHPGPSRPEVAQTPDDDALSTQVQLIASRDIARDAIKALDLQSRPEFDWLARGQGDFTRLLVLLGIERDPAQIAPEERVLNSYYERLAVAPLEKSRVLRVRFTSQSPELAAKAANAIADLYINLRSGMKGEQASSIPALTGARIVARAVVPEVPSIPKKGQMIVLFMLAGLVLAAGLVVAWELLTAEAPPRDLELGSMPIQLGGGELASDVQDDERRRLRRRLVSQSMQPDTAHAPMPSMGEEHNGRLAAMLAEISDRVKQRSAVRVVIAGAEPEIGIMPFALNLARSLARQDRVILVDCGAEPATLTDLLKTAEEGDSVPGLTDLLVGDTTFAEVIHRDPMSRLHIVPIGSGVLDQGHDGFDKVVDALAETYDHVLLAVPAPPWSVGELPGVISSDFGVLLCAPGMTQVAIGVCRAALQAVGLVDIMVVEATSDRQEARARTAA
jgi:capsular polysaccharide biosynthesis protein